MGQAVLDGDPPIALALRRSARARRISLRVSRLDGRVTLSLPAGLDEAEALRFARSREAWLRRVLAGCAAPCRPAPGLRLPVEGRELPLVGTDRRSAGLFPDRIEIPHARPGPALAALLRHLARDRAEAAVARHAAALGRPWRRLSLRDTRSRWGSCSAEGDLMLSWRLVLAPPPILDYVAAHEVGHLAHMDHSPAFWSVVRRLCPDHAAARGWLRRDGAALHRWRFD